MKIKLKYWIFLLTFFLILSSCNKNFNSMIYNDYMKVYHDSYLEADMKVVRSPKLVLGDTIILDCNIEFLYADEVSITSGTKTIVGYTSDSLVLVNNSGMFYEFELLKGELVRVIILKRKFEGLFYMGRIMDYKINFYEQLLSSKDELIDSLLKRNDIDMEKLNFILDEECNKRYGERWKGIPF